MKKGYTLIETITSVLILSALFTIVFSLLLKGIKYKSNANEYYNEYVDVNNIIDSFDRLFAYYDNTVISVSSNTLISGSTLILTYYNNVLTFNFGSGIKEEYFIEDGLSFRLVNSKLLKVELNITKNNIVKYYYMGGN